MSQDHNPPPAKGWLNRFAVGVGRTVVPERGDKDGPLPPILLLLTFMTGVLDGVSYLGLGTVFVAVMTGNVVLLGFAIAGAPDLSVASSALALISFLLGATAAGRLARQAAHRGQLLAIGSATEAALIAAALAVSVSASGALRQYVLIALLAAAMGTQNAIVGKLSVAELKTTVLTLTLTGLASELASGRTTGRRVLAILTTILGAILGGWLTLRAGISYAIAVCLLLSAVSALSAVLLSRSHPSWVEWGGVGKRG
ncbi:YoaK family protein [Arthrobacter sp. ISL-28]|uniref:YoaK family protein n=1 Tax=Arthrobacter sp. ISL-28 TaxID=2819108 RepID=UPI001BE8D068|nr:YoaK family protein [Arthrobacter sp. ISL-28]MBT2523822.1 DUF1275 domain-containing protein [Arthrobacter sp. ISL-28]